MRRWAGLAVTKKRHVQKNGSFLTVTSSVNGIQKISALNSGICSTEENTWVNISACFRSQTGRKWMYGNTSTAKIFQSQNFTSPTSEKLLSVMAPFSRHRRG